MPMTKVSFSIAAREVITQYLPELLPADDDDVGDKSGDGK